MLLYACWDGDRCNIVHGVVCPDGGEADVRFFAKNGRAFVHTKAVLPPSVADTIPPSCLAKVPPVEAVMSCFEFNKFITETVGLAPGSDAGHYIEVVMEQRDSLRPLLDKRRCFEDLVEFLLRKGVDCAHHAVIFQRLLDVSKGRFIDVKSVKNQKLIIKKVIIPYAEYVGVHLSAHGDSERYVRVNSPLLLFEGDDPPAAAPKRPLEAARSSPLKKPREESTATDEIKAIHDEVARINAITYDTLLQSSGNVHRVAVRKTGVSFGELVDYCRGTTKEVPGLPPRSAWRSNPPMLLRVDCEYKNQYLITDIGGLELIDRKEGIHEVFIPGLPVTRLTLDVDMPACADCLSDDRHLHAIVRGVKNVLCATVSSFTRTKRDIEPLELGTLLVYRRKADKMSLRVVWLLPLPLAGKTMVQLAPLLETVNETSMGIPHMCYEVRTSNRGRAVVDPLCGKIMLDVSKARAEHTVERVPCLDMAPFAPRKSVRLPNFSKDGQPFAYKLTDGPAHVAAESATCGVSCQRMLVRYTPIVTDLQLPNVPDHTASRRRRDLTEIEESEVGALADKLSKLWGVNVHVKTTSAGAVVIAALEKSGDFECPVHRRVHENALLGVVVTGANEYVYKCFVPNTMKIY
jgi:hypothetical protein